MLKDKNIFEYCKKHFIFVFAKPVLHNLVCFIGSFKTDKVSG